MTDKVSKSARSHNMKQITSEDTLPEIKLRRLVYALGFRYRVHVRSLPGSPDLVFRGRKKIVFLHGCFWHKHKGCRDGHMPKSRVAYWIPKLQRNVERDAENERALERAGWEILTVWACEMKDEEEVSARLRTFLGRVVRSTDKGPPR